MNEHSEECECVDSLFVHLNASLSTFFKCTEHCAIVTQMHN